MRLLRSGRLGTAQIQDKHVRRATVELLEQRQLLAAAPISFTDTDGDHVTIRLSGPGTLTMNPDNRYVATADTTVNSVLSISVRRAAGGDGLVTLGELRCYGPMRALIGPKADITREISINDRMQPVSKASKVSLNLGVLHDLAVYTGGQHVGTMKLADWTSVNSGQELNAPTVDSLIITGRKDVAGTSVDESLPGNCGAILILGDGTTAASDWSIRNIRVAGTQGDIQATGRVGRISAGQIDGQLAASSFEAITTHAVRGSSVATGAITGSVTTTGAPGVATSLNQLSADADITNLTVSTTGGIGRVTVGGQLLNSSIVSAGGIGAVSVQQGLLASRIQSQGDVGSVRVGAIGQSSVYVGVAPDFEGSAPGAADFVNSSAHLANFSIVGMKGLAATEPLAFAENTIGAAHIGVMNLRNVDSPAAMQVYALDGPTAVHNTDTMDRTAAFTWHRGQTQPAFLAAMLHQM